MTFPRLNLPEAELRISIENDVHYVWDPIRHKNLVLTPEEWVRQHFLSLLLGERSEAL